MSRQPLLSLAVYNTFIALYAIGARLHASFSDKAKQWVIGRQDVWNQLASLSQGGDRFWIHCASLGEYEQALPLAEKLQEYGQVIVTFFSPSGYQWAGKRKGNFRFFYLPLDSRTHARKFLDIVNPRVAIFVRYDLWYHYLHELHVRNIETILISAVYRPSDIYFRCYGRFFLHMLRFFNRIFVQDKISQSLLESYGFRNVVTAGDTRVDRVAQTVERAAALPPVAIFQAEKRQMVIGSLEPRDYPVVLPVVNDAALRENLRFILAPHDVDADTLARMEREIKVGCVRFSQMREVGSWQVLLLDTVGHLMSTYRYADLVYIGGGFGEGLHNTLEPAAWGKAVLFGPRHHKFPEAEALVEAGAAFVVNNAAQLAECVRELLTGGRYLQAGEKAKKIIEQRKGATTIVWNYLAAHLSTNKYIKP
ncbi:MAG: 3-deoxy-D-manno-octulosonic acid transferase [Chitinophagales bacterium]|nr:MAG: 3-deoxy-D-manno-octulosonic acid transferase [Chitinophagales bacterium]